ncbi:Dolichol kinase sec59 [Serendipita indica DSM 11827]|uniref:dolichol kinase n=1 Tax=Serendipita indica (strain DSM 11827) TaxID=1109443 RepID=G4TDF8_SERID|nr:Dolichol kinase sec59 [Serendipita indica DSM 11827]CCA69351.1 related to SEC59-dolichol kinase [Serendipita indica DSM 11827]
MSRRRRRSTVRGLSRPAVQDYWSTSYNASASSSHHSLVTEDSSTFDDSADDDNGSLVIVNIPQKLSESPHVVRSESPVVIQESPVAPHAVQERSATHTRSVSTIRHSHSTHVHRKQVNLLPKSFTFAPSIPSWSAQVDVRKLCEHVILFTAAAITLVKFSLLPHEHWIVRELGTLTVVSALYMIATRPRCKLPQVVPHVEQGPRTRHVSPPPVKEESSQSLLWMTTPKDYRSDADDGVLTALLLGPITAASMLYATILTDISDGPYYPAGWLVDPPLYLSKSPHRLTPREALLNSRRSLVQFSTLCAFVLLTHLCTSNITTIRPKHDDPKDGERRMKRGLRSWAFVGYAISISAISVLFHVACDAMELAIWKDLSYFDVAVISSFYQFAVYVMIRLSHGGFTLGEVGLVGIGTTALFMEVINLTIAKIWPIATPYIKTTRYPTPLLIYQLSLVSGSISIGFMLSPLLVLSRHISKVPTHRLQRTSDKRHTKPVERETQRKALSISFFLFSLVIIFGLIGFWAQWCLGGKNPWIWILLWLTQGKTKWLRPAMLVYWAALGSFSVGAWGRQLSRSRRYHASNMAIHGTGIPPDPAFASSELPPAPSTPTMANGFAHVATDLLDAADRRVPTLSLNARRKSFHALAIFMFMPGIILDPAFTHFCLSAAFALFVFAEYIRYFALWPFGRILHIFLNEFIDSKDSGSAILSHFYLLTGFANSLWLEGPWRLLEFTGALSLGIGDAMASIIGRRRGRTRWMDGNPKTVEGTLAFLVSVLASNIVLRLVGVVEPFSLWRYTLVLGAGCLLEAVSNQNDNLTIPLFIWSMTVLSDVVR